MYTIKKQVLLTHVYVVFLAILINVTMYMFVTMPNIEKYYSASILTNVGKTIAENNEALRKDLNHEAEDEAAFALLREQLSALKNKVDTTPAQVVVEKNTVERIVEKPQVIEKTIVFDSSPPTLVSDENTDQSYHINGRDKNGEVLVPDAGCGLGYAWMNARLERTCALQ